MAGKSNGGTSAITSTLEWIAAGTGLALTAGIFGLIGWQALHGPQSAPPALQASVSNVERSGDGYVVEVEVNNSSASTAAAVLIEGELRQGAVSAERSEATISYVPAHSHRVAGLIFTRNPRGYDLVVRPVGYERP